jgi:hypothetical protein
MGHTLSIVRLNPIVDRAQADLTKTCQTLLGCVVCEA